MKKALHFSGGKDSLACLHLLRDEWDSLAVVWMNTGAALPETLEQMQGIRDMVPHFIEIKSDQPADIAAHGYPTDVYSFSHTELGRSMGVAHANLWRPGYACCANNLWAPMADAMMDMGITHIVRGQKDCDRRKAPIRNGDVIDGITYLLPLQDWTDEQVIQYLNDAGIELPAHYAYGASSMDCWDCTAYLYEPQRFEYLKARHPERHKIVMGRLGELSDVLKEALSIIEVAHAD